MQRRYSKEALKCILANSPFEEEEMLCTLGFYELVHESLTHVFCVNNKISLDLSMFSSRRLQLLCIDTGVMGDLTMCKVGIAS